MLIIWCCVKGKFIPAKVGQSFLKCIRHFFPVLNKKKDPVTFRSVRLQFRVFTAPFHRVEFADFWLADQLNSLVVVLMDLEYLICFYIFELQWSNSKGLLHESKGRAFIRSDVEQVDPNALHLNTNCIYIEKLNI